MVVTMALAACGSSNRNALPPSAPMPPGADWVGRWTTSVGPLEMEPTAALDLEPGIAADYPYRGRLARDQAEVTLICLRPDDNHLSCGWDEWQGEISVRSGVMVLVMSRDGASFVANLGSRERTERITGQRIP
jgi:hypothetical protein